MSARRHALRALSHGSTTHAGLWLSKYLTAQTDGEGAGTGAKAQLMREVCATDTPVGYAEAFERWRSGLGSRVQSAQATVAGRMIVGLGAKGAAEAAIHLDHTWGVPLIPGSALKGLASSTAHLALEDAEWRKGGKDHRVLFGTTEESGQVRFLDAWWDPTGAAKLPLHLDVMTVHHQEYYQGGNTPPADTDDPNPIAFVSASGRYLIAVEPTNPEAAEAADQCRAALEILAIGLADLGVGAKTNAGYGRMTLTYPLAPADPLAPLLKQLSKSNAADMVNRALKASGNQLPAEFAQAALRKLDKKWVQARIGQPWAKALLDAAQ